MLKSPALVRNVVELGALAKFSRYSVG